MRTSSVFITVALVTALGFAIRQEFFTPALAYEYTAAQAESSLAFRADLLPVASPSVAALESIASSLASTTATNAAPVERTPVAVTSRGPVADPLRLSIPAASIDAPVQAVGVNNKGEMAVPSGATNNVGWYKYGAVPGEHGTAVIDAHVFAAFQNLDQVKPGTDIYVTTENNERLHFVVSKVATYKLSELTSSMLFTRGSGRNLNLITCAGELTPDHSTYDHRLIVYTTLVS